MEGTYVKRTGKSKRRWHLNDNHYRNYGDFSTCGKSYRNFLVMGYFNGVTRTVTAMLW